MVTKQTIFRGGKNAVKVIINLTKYIIPAIFVLKILEHSGWLIRIADFFSPYMAYMGLPGEGALVIMMGQVSLYSAIAAMVTLGLTARQITIMSTFVSICHALAIETVVIGKSGGNGLLNAGLRFIAAVLACLALNLIIPGV
ncbi:MAG TPA: nucleoside recognition domain-containing protein [Clostridia bacterium]|nr:nucleoside recognition domain-containing protein [Clostridia bacterium]